MEIGDARILLQLLLIIVIVAVVARRLVVPYPILMVLAGVAVSLAPGLPAVQLDPDLILHVVLPLLLYRAAWQTSWPALRRNLGLIVLLAVGLVLFTTLGVAAIAPHFLPGFDRQTAFILGAVIAPTDAIAATAIARRLRLRKHLTDIIEEESLVNDATGLLAFNLAVAALLRTRIPTLQSDVLDFGYVVVVGIVIGLAVAVVAERVERGIDDAAIVIASNVLIPFGAYLAAQALNASGFLAVVACGVLHSRRSDQSRAARVRLESEIVWKTLAFVLNGMVFVLIGLQLREILAGLRGMPARSLLFDVLAFSAIVIVLRLLWVFPAMSFATYATNRVLKRKDPPSSMREAFLIGWAGMRGVIALAAAMSLPRSLADGRPFVQRPMIIFLTFGAIFVSVVLKGLTLPSVIRGLGLREETAESEDGDARRLVAESGLAILESLHESGAVHDAHYESLKSLYTTRAAPVNDSARFQEILRAMLRAEREAALQLRKESRITDDVLRSLLSELDLAETRATAQS